jgi:cob(I)alamin adenosyltransferase
MSSSPRILLFTGDGKGKTTAALGMALRASGHGLSVGMVQFVKGDSSVGELAATREFPRIKIVQAGLGFLPPAGDPRLAGHHAAARQGLRLAAEMIAGGQFDMLILDEICLAVARGLLEEGEVEEVLQSARPEMCLVLTGRQATPGLVALCDTVTEMRCVKHALAAGRAAEKGVEL